MIKSFILWMIFAPFGLMLAGLIAACMGVGLVCFLTWDPEPFRIFLDGFDNVPWMSVRLAYLVSFVLSVAVWPFGD